MDRIRPPCSTRPALRCAKLALAALAMSPGAGAFGMAERAGPGALAPHRDGNVAVAQELDAARRKGTIAAYDLFLARHPDHRLARTARRERHAIAERHRRPG